MGGEKPRAMSLNCEGPVPRLYCGRCGQKNAPLRVPLWRHIYETVETHLFLDSRMARTLPAFLFRPGFLTREHNDGRRVRYSSPLRLYLLMSLLLFVGVGVSRFAADFIFMRHLLAEQAGSAAESGAPWFPAPPGSIAALTDPATETIEELTRKLSEGPMDYEQSISRTIVELLGEDRPMCQFIVKKMETVRGMGWAEARLAGLDNWLNLLPTAMFLLLPFCAALLKFCFLGTGRYYVEHLIFVLHLHAFIYLVLLILSWVWNPQTIAIALCVIVAHILLGLRTAYRASVLETLVRGPLFLALYAGLLVAGLGATFWISLMLI